MTKIFTLRGKANSGKTTSIKILYDQLIAGGATVIYYKSLIGPINYDFMAILRDVNGLYIGVISQGDIGQWLSNYLTELIQELQLQLPAAAFHAIVCATRTRGMTVTAVDDFAVSNGFQMKCISQTIVNGVANQAVANNNMATNIYNSMSE